MDIDSLISSLHPLEKKALKHISARTSDGELVKNSGMQKVEVLRALMWLKDKGIVSLSEKVVEEINLDENGEKYRRLKLPEQRFLEEASKVGAGIKEKERRKSLDEIKRDANLDDDEFAISIGILRRLSAIEATPEKKFVVTEKGKKLLKQGFPERDFLNKSFPVKLEDLDQSGEKILNELKKRKSIVRITSVKRIDVELTSLGKDILKKGIPSREYLDALTPSLMVSGHWKGREFRRYNIRAPVPRIFAGRKQPYRRFIEEVREKFLALGFTEMTGPIVETEFWNMDSLFMPQFHSARDIHDAYYVKSPEYASGLPKKIVENVRRAHESGFGTGSRGWRYKFDVRRTHRHVLRTQDTAISPRTLSSPSLKIPGKYFQIVRCFRYDVIDATHLPDFNQTGGFVVEKNLNLRHLFGLLRLFAKEFADADQIKVVPAYFPFTEPSAALYAKHPEIGWIELAGAGMFRPEMTAPLGVKEPVIAWGVGLERLAMFRLGLKDIRQLFSHDLEFLRSARMI